MPASWEWDGVLLEEFPPFNPDTHLEFEMVGPGIAKMRGGDIFVFDGRSEACGECGGQPDAQVVAGIKRRKNPEPYELATINRCPACYGTGNRLAIRNYCSRRFGDRAPSWGGREWTLAEIRSKVVERNLIGGGRLHLFRVPPSVLAGIAGSLSTVDSPSGGSVDNPRQSGLSTVDRLADTPSIERRPREGIHVPIISSVALKGGTGKTTLTHMLCGALAANRRVLAIDNDAQGSLSSGIFGPTAVEAMVAEETIAALYGGLDPLPEQIIRPSPIPNLDVIAGSRAAARFNTPDPHEAPVDLQVCLRSFLAEVRDDYDVVLIDNPPNLSLASWAALIASDFLFVPVVPEDYGAASLTPVFESVALVQSGPNRGLINLGLVLSMVQPRLAVHALYEQTLRELHGSRIFDTRVLLATDIKESIARRLTVAQHKPRGASAKIFKALADEMFTRIESHVAAKNQEAA